VDEWLLYIKSVVLLYLPSFKFRSTQFIFNPSHDVDNPAAYSLVRPKRLLSNLLTQLTSNSSSFRSSSSGFFRSILSRYQLSAEDPFVTYDYLMDVSEEYGTPSTFFFMAGSTHKSYDTFYSLKNPKILHLLRHIVARGHRLGLHPSYNTLDDSNLLNSEVTLFRRVLDSINYDTTPISSRNHYLRWSSYCSLNTLEQAGIQRDYSLAYADMPGFRASTCFPFVGYNHFNDCSSTVICYPLIAMESSILDTAYLALSTTPSAFSLFQQLISSCQSVNGCFSLLWHNCHLTSSADRLFYKSLFDLIFHPP